MMPTTRWLVRWTLACAIAAAAPGARAATPADSAAVKAAPPGLAATAMTKEAAREEKEKAALTAKEKKRAERAEKENAARAAKQKKETERAAKKAARAGKKETKAVVTAPATAPATAHAAAYAAVPAAAPARALAPLGRRTSDEMVDRDLSAIEAWKAKLDTATAGWDPWRATAARLWLEVAREEYLDNDESGFERTAFAAATELIVALESGAAPMTRESVPAAQPLAGSARLRGDLWDKLETLKRDEGFSCAAAELAALEVELQWAGHESADRGGCATGPHLEAAARHALEAEALVPACRKPPPPPVVVEPPPPPPPVKPQMPTREEIRVPKEVHFAVAKYDIGPISRRVIIGVANVLIKYPAVYVHLTGHTDSRGSEAYNLLLSQRRVRAVFDALRETGVDSVRITIEFVGKAKLYAAEVSTKAYALNRRVEMEFQDAEGREVKGERTEADLQVESEKPPPPPPAPKPPRRRTTTVRPAGAKPTIVKPRAAAPPPAQPVEGVAEGLPYRRPAWPPANGAPGQATIAPRPATSGRPGSTAAGAKAGTARTASSTPRIVTKPRAADSTARRPR